MAYCNGGGCFDPQQHWVPKLGQNCQILLCRTFAINSTSTLALIFRVFLFLHVCLKEFSLYFLAHQQTYLLDWIIKLYTLLL
jgi:hypothetical protein